MSPAYLMRRYQAEGGVPVVTAAGARGAVVGVCHARCSDHPRAHRRGGTAFQVRLCAGGYDWRAPAELRRARAAAAGRRIL